MLRGLELVPKSASWFLAEGICEYSVAQILVAEAAVTAQAAALAAAWFRTVSLTNEAPINWSPQKHCRYPVAARVTTVVGCLVLVC